MNASDLFEIIQKGNNYSVYKRVKVVLVKPTYKSDGLTESGNKYYEYKDASKYCVTDNKNNSVKKFDLKKRSIADAFGKEKTASFFTQHKKDPVDETFLKNPVLNFNQQEFN